MDAAMIKANLETSGFVEVSTASGVSVVAIVRRGEWRGSPTLAHYPVMIALSRIWRLTKRERGWLVEVREPVESEGDVVGSTPSRDSAVDLAIEVAERLLGDRAK